MVGLVWYENDAPLGSDGTAWWLLVEAAAPLAYPSGRNPEHTPNTRTHWWTVRVGDFEGKRGARTGAADAVPSQEEAPHHRQHLFGAHARTFTCIRPTTSSVHHTHTHHASCFGTPTAAKPATATAAATHLDGEHERGENDQKDLVAAGRQRAHHSDADDAQRHVDRSHDKELSPQPHHPIARLAIRHPAPALARARPPLSNTVLPPFHRHKPAPKPARSSHHVRKSECCSSAARLRASPSRRQRT